MNGTATKKILGLALFALFGALSLSGVDFRPDTRKIDPILLPTDDPAIAAAQRKRMEVPGRPDLPVPVFIHLNREDPEFPERLPNLGGSGSRVGGRLVTGRIPRDAARYLSNWPQVAYIESAKRVRPMLDLSRPAVSADVVQAGTGLPSPFTGAGTYVGIVDSGLDNTHLDFHENGSGSALRVDHTYADASELISWGVSANPLVDEDGHGTHVTGIVAGNGYMSSGSYTGIAPGARILFGKTSFMDTDIVNAVADLVSFAEGKAMPVSINLSLGGVIGPHDGTSGFEKGINDLSAGSPGSKRIVSVAAGNETGYGEHFQAALGSFGTTSISVSFLPFTTDGTVDIWADGDDQFTVSAITGTDCVTVLSGASGTSSHGKITVSNKVTAPTNGATNISVYFQSLTTPKTGTIRLERTRNGGTGKVDAYIDGYYDGTFNSPSDTSTIIEPANGNDVLAVASFDTKSLLGSAIAQNISSFSSLGPTRDGRIKPDIAAPGYYIYSARSYYPGSIVHYVDLVPGNGNYAIQDGTSVATPHVTGIAALVWESNPALSGAQLRERIRRTADAPTDSSSTPNTTWGYGKANALHAVSNSVASITAPAKTTPGATVPLSSENSSGAFGDASLSYSWSLARKPAGSGRTLSSTAPSTTFTPDVPGDYTIALAVSDPSAASPGSATSALHVNNVPVASISGSASDNVGVPVSFSGLGSTDADHQTLAYRWVLVSRPSGSAATLSSADIDNVSFTPDTGGTYEIGLRVDDGLDNSALVTYPYSPQSPSSSSGGGGGGCSIAGHSQDAGGHTPVATVFALLFPAAILAIRRFRKSLRKSGVK